MTFNEADVNRKEDGKFGEKVGSGPEVNLSADKAEHSLISRVQSSFKDGITPKDEKTVDMVQERLSSHPTTALIEAAELLSGKMEDHNWHSRGLKLDVAVSQARRKAYPDDPIAFTSSVMKASDDMDFVREAYVQRKADLIEGYLKAGRSAKEAEDYATSRTDGVMVLNENLSGEVVKEIYDRTDKGDWVSAEARRHPNFPTENGK